MKSSAHSALKPANTRGVGSMKLLTKKRANWKEREDCSHVSNCIWPMPGNGLIRQMDRFGTNTALRRDCGIVKSPKRSNENAQANKVLLNWKKKSPVHRSLRNCMISPVCSAKRTVASVFPRGALCKLRRHCTRGTR